MSTLANLYNDLKTLCKQWFYDKSEVDEMISTASGGVTDYRNYTIVPSSYNPNIDENLTVSVTVTDMKGNLKTNENVSLFYKTSSLPEIELVQTTNSSGVATFTPIPMSDWGIVNFRVRSVHCQVNVDGWKYENGTSSSAWATQRNKDHGRLILRGWGNTRSATSSWADTGMTVTFPPRMPVMKAEQNAKIEFLVNEQGTVRFRRALTQSANVTQSNYLQLDWTIS